MFQVNKSKELLGILLANTGTPDDPNPSAIKRYLREFLSDKRIIQIPRFIWLPILFLFILNIRPYKKTEDYKKIWTEEGSPLLVISNRLLKSIQKEEKNKNFLFSIAMRYGNPSIKSQLSLFKKKDVKKVIIFPMFPQYSFSTTESIRDKVFEILHDLDWKPKLIFIEDYYNEKIFIKAIANNIRINWEKKGRSQLLIFTYHGLPKKYVNQGDPYYPSCLNTTKLIAKELSLLKSEFITSFHSKFGFGEWTKPYTEDLLLQMPKNGIKNISVISPTFSIDCLETLEEINIQFRKEFIKAGGNKFNYIPCLNDSKEQVRLIQHLVDKNLYRN